MNEPPAAADPTQLDPDLAARLRASSEERIAAQVQAARQQAAGKRAVRASFAQSRAAGLRARHSAKAARLRMIANHNEPEENQK